MNIDKINKVDVKSVDREELSMAKIQEHGIAATKQAQAKCFTACCSENHSRTTRLFEALGTCMNLDDEMSKVAKPIWHWNLHSKALSFIAESHSLWRPLPAIQVYVGASVGEY